MEFGDPASSTLNLPHEGHSGGLAVAESDLTQYRITSDVIAMMEDRWIVMRMTKVCRGAVWRRSPTNATTDWMKEAKGFNSVIIAMSWSSFEQRG